MKFNDFEAAFSEFAERVDAKRQETRNAFRQLMAELYTAIVKSTPVDTGRARSAWIVQSEVLIGQVSEGGSISLKEIPNNKAPLVFDFRNGVNYIVFLEHGTSKQAPQGMVSVNVKRATDNIRRAIERLAK